MADNILFKSGLASKLNDITKTAGQLLFAIDGTSGSIYLDKDSTTRIKMNLDATKLQTARNINGTSFDGTASITTANWGTARDITIGNSTKPVNGSAAVIWTLSDMGAVSKAGDTMNGELVANATSVADIGVAQVRNIWAGIADIGEVENSLNEGDIYLQYEEV